MNKMLYANLFKIPTVTVTFTDGKTTISRKDKGIRVRIVDLRSEESRDTDKGRQRRFTVPAYETVGRG